jgi:flagellar basal-body rod protein FlgB
MQSQGDPPVLYDTTQIALERTIQGASQRNEALAANLANANTPGYQRVDVDFHSTLAQAMGQSQPTASLRTASFSTQTDGTGATRADGSTVDVDAESAKLAANGLEHQTAVQIAGARLDIMRSAMGVG